MRCGTLQHSVGPPSRVRRRRPGRCHGAVPAGLPRHRASATSDPAGPWEWLACTARALVV